jgi:Lon protease-like protein
MVARCLEFDKRFGFLFHDPDEYASSGIEPGRVGCVAQIIAFRPLPDGRSLMVVEGIERFRVEDGVESETLYDEVVAETYEDERESQALLVVRRQRSIRLLESVLRSLSTPADSQLELDPRRETSFELAAYLEVDPAWNQRLLEIRKESERLDLIDELLRAAFEADQSGWSRG